MSFRFSSSFVSLCIIVCGLWEGSFVTRFAACAFACVAEVSFCSQFFGSFGTGRIRVFESSSSVEGGRSQVPFSILISCCFLFVSPYGCPTLPYVSISGGFRWGAFASAVLLLPIISSWVSCRPSVSTIMPVRLLSISMSYPLSLEFVLYLSMSYLQLYYVQK